MYTAPGSTVKNNSLLLISFLYIHWCGQKMLSLKHTMLNSVELFFRGKFHFFSQGLFSHIPRVWGVTTSTSLMPRLHVRIRMLWWPLLSSCMGHGEMVWIGAMLAGLMTEPCSTPSLNPDTPAEERRHRLDWEPMVGSTGPTVALMSFALQQALKVR